MVASRRWWRQLGPGLITGAADDDPSGIATYSQAGAGFGYLLRWTLVLTYPLMVGILMVSARMGRVTGRGLAANIGQRFPRPVVYAVVLMLVVANIIDIAADIAAMGDALNMLAGTQAHETVIVIGLLSVLLQAFILGILGTGLLAVPILAGSAAYAMAETFQWRAGLDLELLQACEFYAIIALATLRGVAIDFMPIDSIQALYWSAVINGVIAVPILLVMMLLADDPAVMGTFTITRPLKVLGSMATWTMAAAVVAMFVMR